VLLPMLDDPVQRPSKTLFAGGFIGGLSVLIEAGYDSP
jgi:hypothetical protein